MIELKVSGTIILQHPGEVNVITWSLQEGGRRVREGDVTTEAEVRMMWGHEQEGKLTSKS